MAQLARSVFFKYRDKLIEQKDGKTKSLMNSD